MARLNIQSYVISYLARELSEVTVRARVPSPTPERLVVVRRAGGGRINRLQDRPGVHLLIWGGSEWETSELASRVGDLMDALNRSDAAFIDGVEVVVEESLRSAPDPTAKPEVPRWFGSYTITTHKYDE